MNENREGVKNAKFHYDAVRKKLQRRQPVILDGGIGTEILRRDVSWADHQILSYPDLIRSIHEDYIKAGADVITTNTFQLTRRALLNHFRDLEHMRHIGAPDLDTRADRLLREAVELTLQARQEVPGNRPVAVAGSMTTLEWCFRPDLSPSPKQAQEEYAEVARAFKEAGADLILLETVNNTREAVAALKAFREVGIPAWISFVCDNRGRLFSGETAADALGALEPLGVEAILLNCAPPQDITAGLRQLAPQAHVATGAYAHIGRFDPPEWHFTDEYPPPQYLEVCRQWMELGATIVGGCCGTTPEHIALLRELCA